MKLSPRADITNFPALRHTAIIREGHDDFRERGPFYPAGGKAQGPSRALGFGICSVRLQAGATKNY